MGFAHQAGTSDFSRVQGLSKKNIMIEFNWDHDLPWIDIEDKDAVDQMKPLLQENPTIIEAGCCDGADTIRFKKVWPKSTIFTFEPNPDLYEIAKRNLEKEGLYDVTLNPLA